MENHKNILTTLKELVKPSHCAVVVIDMQNDFCHQEGFYGQAKFDTKRLVHKPVDEDRTTACIHNISELIEAARMAGVRVYFTRNIGDSRYRPAPLLLRDYRLGRTRGICEEGSWGAEFVDGLIPHSHDTIITKHVYSAFIGTDFETILRNDGIKTLVVTGRGTPGCVESTVRDGCMLGFYIVEPRDCVTSRDIEEHERSLSRVDQDFGWVTTSEEVVHCWQMPS